MLKKESQPWFNEIIEKVRARAAAVWIKKLINSDILLLVCSDFHVTRIRTPQTTFLS